MKRHHTPSGRVGKRAPGGRAPWRSGCRELKLTHDVVEPKMFSPEATPARPRPSGVFERASRCYHHATMKWASAISQNNRLESALKECAQIIHTQLGEAPVDFAAMFISQNFSGRYEEAHSLLSDRLKIKTLIGASAGGVIGDGQEIEHKPAVSLIAARLPKVRLRPFSIQDDDLPDLDASPRAWEALVNVTAAEDPQFLVLADPFSINTDNFILGLDYAFPKSAKVGGLASGASEPGRNALYLNNLCLRSGLVGVALSGNIQIDTIVAQGCRPIGKPVRVTECQENVLSAIDGKPPLQVLQELFQQLPERDKQLLRQSLFLGIAMNSANDRPQAGDFLIRNIIGVDNERGILAIGAPIREGQWVQFHLRDAQASEQDLLQMFEKMGPLRTETRGALLFSCVGRGQKLYGRAHHDSRFFLQNIGPVPLGGLFCNGEIGPVGGTTYLHGYTSCFGLFRPKA